MVGRRAKPIFSVPRWIDALPTLVQSRLLQSFENYDIAHAPLRGDALRERCAGHLTAARIFERSVPIEKLSTTQAAAAFSQAFDALARDVVIWTVSAR